MQRRAWTSGCCYEKMTCVLHSSFHSYLAPWSCLVYAHVSTGLVKTSAVNCRAPIVIKVRTMSASKRRQLQTLDELRLRSLTIVFAAPLRHSHAMGAEVKSRNDVSRRGAQGAPSSSLWAFRQQRLALFCKQVCAPSAMPEHALGLFSDAESWTLAGAPSSPPQFPSLSSLLVCVQSGLVYAGIVIATIAEASLAQRWADVPLLCTYAVALCLPAVASHLRAGALIVPVYVLSNLLVSLCDLGIALGWLPFLRAIRAVYQARQEMLGELMCSLPGQVR